MHFERLLIFRKTDFEKEKKILVEKLLLRKKIDYEGKNTFEGEN